MDHDSSDAEGDDHFVVDDVVMHTSADAIDTGIDVIDVNADTGPAVATVGTLLALVGCLERALNDVKLKIVAVQEVEAYISPYEGRARVERLRYIAARFPALKEEALRLACLQLRGGAQPKLLQQLAADLRALNGVEAVPTKAEVDEVLIQLARTREALEHNLKTQRGNMLKEAIRVATFDLAAHYYGIGDVTTATKFYTRARDYCTTNKHIVDVCLRVLKNSLELKQWQGVHSYAAKGLSALESLKTDPDTPRLRCLLQCYLGLAHLAASENFAETARVFLQVPFEHGATFGDVISAREIGVYGGLCALAEFDRPELKRRLLDNVLDVFSVLEFKEFLELNIELRGVIRDFYASRYSDCLLRLENLRGDLLLDMYLAPFVNSLIQKIRCRALVQYFSPFLSVDMRKMALAFNTTAAALEADIAGLIGAGALAARIDSDRQILHVRQVDTRATTFKAALQSGRAFEVHVQGMLLRQAIIAANLTLKSAEPAGKRFAQPMHTDEDLAGLFAGQMAGF